MDPVDRLLAHEEIRQLAARYAVCTDARDLDGLMALYVPEVRDRLRPLFDEALRGVGVTILHVGTHVIDLAEDGEHATGIVYCRGEIQDGGLDSDRWIVQGIQYHDTYERRGGHWFFARNRRHLLVYGAELGVNPLGLAPANWPEHQTGTGTLPHDLETWQRFWADGEPGASRP